MRAYDGHPLDLTCPQCLTNGTAWFSADEARHLRIDLTPPGFRLTAPSPEASGPLFTCLQCEIEASRL